MSSNSVGPDGMKGVVRPQLGFPRRRIICFGDFDPPNDNRHYRSSTRGNGPRRASMCVVAVLFLGLNVPRGLCNLVHSVLLWGFQFGWIHHLGTSLNFVG